MPNWLPLPGVADESQVQRHVHVDEEDGFSKATVDVYYPRQGYGYIVSDGGKRIRFDMRMARLIGPRTDAKELKEGARVGFDVGKTARGPLVCALKIY